MFVCLFGEDWQVLAQDREAWLNASLAGADWMNAFLDVGRRSSLIIEPYA